MFHPSTVRVPIPEGGELVGSVRLCDTPEDSPAILWVHGFGSHRGGEKALAVQEESVRRGWSFAAFDFRGHGDSTGTMAQLTASRLVEDLTLVCDALPRRLYLFGSSMGGFAACWFARRYPERVAGVILLAPALRFLQRRRAALTPEQLRDWQSNGTMEYAGRWLTAELGYGLIAETDDYAPETLAAGWRHPTLIFHGRADDTVPLADTIDFACAVPDRPIELVIYPTGDHRLTEHRDAIARRAGDWVARCQNDENRG